MTNPYQLGIHLGIDTHELDKIEHNSESINQQMIKIIKYWLDINKDPSWKDLADAVEKMRGYRNLVTNLTKQHKDYLQAIKAI